MEEYIFSVSKDDSGLRLDKFLAENMPEFSRSYLRTLIDDGKSSVNGKVSKASKKLSFKDSVLLFVEPPKEIDVLPVNIPVEILYEDEDLIIVNKPKGMPVHPSNGHYDDTLVNSLLYTHKSSLSGINGLLRPGIVHRIDMDTTGSLVVCKNDDIHRKMAEIFKNHDITRRYVGIVYGTPREIEGTVNFRIGRDPKNRLRNTVTESGKEAVTHYKVLESFGDYSLVEFALETGRTHQIRVHMAYIKHPLLGDPLYGPKKCPFKLDGQCLHASTIGFVHPRTEKYIEVSADYPAYFNDLLSKLK